jgi:hypothetical protein
VRPVIAVEELGGVGNLTSPSLPTRKATGAWWHPEHHAALIEIGAHEEPLPTTEMPRPSHRYDALVEAAGDLDAEPTVISAAQVGGDDATSDVALITVGPYYASRASGCAWADKSAAHQRIDVELEAIL